MTHAKLIVVTWLWEPLPHYRTKFAPLHVNLMRERVAQYYLLPHEFVCVTDRKPEEFDARVRVVPLWPDHADLPSAFTTGPSCYRRLRIFATNAHDLLGVPEGSTIVSLDLDSVPCGLLDSVWGREEKFVGWNASKRAPCCGSMFMLKLGSFPHVWDEFDHKRAVAEARAHDYVGTDQARMACALAGVMASWTTADGVYSFKNDLLGRHRTLPADARIVFFHGKPDPWDEDVRRKYKWIEQHYPMEMQDHGDYRLQGTL